MEMKRKKRRHQKVNTINRASIENTHEIYLLHLYFFLFFVACRLPLSVMASIYVTHTVADQNLFSYVSLFIYFLITCECIIAARWSFTHSHENHRPLTLLQLLRSIYFIRELDFVWLTTALLTNRKYKKKWQKKKAKNNYLVVVFVCAVQSFKKSV